jgi:hypothetical protein
MIRDILHKHGMFTVHLELDLLRHFEKLRNELLEAQWIDVNDKLPEPEQFVLAFYDGPIPRLITGNDREVQMIVRRLVADDGLRYADEGVTHWMPLPAPPPNQDEQ